MEADTQMALSEYQAAVEGTPEAQAETAQSNVEYVEIPVGAQTYKIPLNAEVPIKHNGQIVKSPLEKLLNTYRQAAHVEDKFKEYKELRSKFDQERGDFDQYKSLRDKYGAIQDWSEKNPQEWERLWELFQQRNQVLTQMPNGESQYQINPDILRVKEELEELKSFKSQFEKTQEEQRTQEDIKAIEGEIESFKKEFPHVDLNEKDLDGISLQGLIIKHGLEKGYPDFRSSALTYPGLLTRLLDTAVKTGRTETVKAVKKDTANGIIARTNTPNQGQGFSGDTRRLGESDRMEKALQELTGLLGQQQ